MRTAKAFRDGKMGLAVIQHLWWRSPGDAERPYTPRARSPQAVPPGGAPAARSHLVLVRHFNALFKHVVFLPQALYGGPIGGEIKVHEGDQLLGG